MENFNLMAKDFDTDKRIERSKVIADKIRLYIKNGNTKTAMEYGCGTGLVGLQLTNEFMELMLVDSSSEMITQVSQKLEQLNKPTISARCADFMETVPQNLHFYYIFSSLVLHHIKDTESILRCFYNMLFDNGHLLIVDLDTDNGSFHAKYPDFEGHNGFEKSSLITLAQKVGFTKVECETFYHDSKIVNGIENPYSLFILDAIK